jgi:glycosyltransferase involved in cell wall biosynthesis
VSQRTAPAGRLWPRLRRQADYHRQRLAARLQSVVPRSLRQVMKAVVRRLERTWARGRLEAALAEAARDSARYAVICLPIIDWRWRVQRPQHLLSALAREGHRVYYLRTDFELGRRATLDYLAPNVFGLRLPGPAHLDISAAELPADLLNTWLAALDELRRAQHIGEAVCLVQLPFWGPLALAARGRWNWRVVYDCMDELAEFSSTRPAMLAQEEALIADSDLVMTTAQVLYDRCAPLARRCIRVPNASDFEHFRQPTPQPVLLDLQPPVIGYYGALSDWFEPEYVRAAAQAHPDWQFVLIGLDAGTRLTMLEALPNVHLLGEQPYATLPAYLHRFDAVMIPFKINALTRATSPVKFYEYLSAGKPIVAVDLPELRQFRHLFYPAASIEEFVRQLEAAVAESDQGRVSARLAVARENLWTQRAHALNSEARRLYPAVTILAASPSPGEAAQFLCHLERATIYPNYEVIVAGSGVEAMLGGSQTGHLQSAARLTLAQGSTPAELAEARDRALAHSTSEYIALLGPQTLVLEGWLNGLVQHLQQDEQIGLAAAVIGWHEGPVSNGRLTPAALADYAARNARAPSGTRHEVRGLEIVCAVLRREAYLAAGPIGRCLEAGLAGSLDYCQRLRRAGYRVVRAEDVCAHHWGWAANGRRAAPEWSGGPAAASLPAPAGPSPLRADVARGLQ